MFRLYDIITVRLTILPEKLRKENVVFCGNVRSQITKNFEVV